MAFLQISFCHAQNVFCPMYLSQVKAMFWTNIELISVSSGPLYSSRVFSARFSLLMFIGSIVNSFSTVRQASRIFHSMSIMAQQHSTRFWPTCQSFFWCSDILVVKFCCVCPTKMDPHPLHFISCTTWDFRSLL